MSGNVKHSVWLAFIWFSLQTMRPAELFSEEAESKRGEADTGNIGFMKNPPTALHERFPMCDAFLKVEWLNKTKKIGYSRYETILKGEAIQSRGKRMLVSALVNLEDIESISYDISFYRRQGRLNEIVNRVRHGNVEGVLPMVISYKGEVLHVHPGILLSNNDFVQPLLSDHQQTVCVAYPNGKRAWIAEGKSVERTYGEEQRINLTCATAAPAPPARSCPTFRA